MLIPNVYYFAKELISAAYLGIRPALFGTSLLFPDITGVTGVGIELKRDASGRVEELSLVVYLANEVPGLPSDLSVIFPMLFPHIAVSWRVTGEFVPLNGGGRGCGGGRRRAHRAEGGVTRRNTRRGSAIGHRSAPALCAQLQPHTGREQSTHRHQRRKPNRSSGRLLESTRNRGDGRLAPHLPVAFANSEPRRLRAGKGDEPRRQSANSGGNAGTHPKQTAEPRRIHRRR